jgi:dipeptidyl aminopeptidase/acylaminoacyl peptidase
MVYFRGSHKSSKISLMRQPVAGGKAKTVFKTRGYYQLTDLSPDGKRALVFKLPSLSRSVLKVVDLKTGKARRLAPPKGKKAHAHTGRFSPDGRSVYVITDEDAEVAGLNRIDAKTGKVLTSFNDYVAEVADVEVSPNSPFVAVLLNAGSHHSVKLLDAESLEEKLSARLPKGAMGLGRFTPDGKGLVVTVSTASQPTDVMLVDTRRGRARPLRRDRRPGLRKLARVKTTVERLATFDKMKVPINVYLPARLPRGKKLPVIVSIHGGPAAASSIHWNPTLSFWISRGFAVVEPNVRGSTGFGKKYEKADNKRKRMDALKDLAAVNEWIRLQPWADTKRLVVYGGSYGGYMTYMALGHQPELWNAGIGAVGVVNLLTFLRTTSGRIRPLITAEFGSLKKDRKFLKKISPIKVVKKIRAPVFIYQGLNDPRVPRAEQDQLVRALRKRGVVVEYMIAEDEGHSISQRHNKLEFVSRSMRFLEENLDLPGPSEACKTAPKTPPKPKKAASKKGKKKKAKKEKAKKEKAKKKKAKKKKAKKKKAKKKKAKAEEAKAGADRGARPADKGAKKDAEPAKKSK